QFSQGLVDGPIIWKRLGDLRIEDDHIRRLEDPLCVLAANQRPKVGTLVFGPQIPRRSSVSLLHSSWSCSGRTLSSAAVPSGVGRPRHVAVRTIGVEQSLASLTRLAVAAAACRFHDEHLAHL